MIIISQEQLEKVDQGVKAATRELESLLSTEEGLNDRKSLNQVKVQLDMISDELHQVSEPIKEASQEELELKRVAFDIQKETHDTPVSFRDFIKGIFMWKETPEDRVKG